jgi:bifunctional non-homologous end joining protein LigD
MYFVPQNTVMSLKLYTKKRNFSKTSEPKGAVEKSNKHRFVVQEHHATRLHFDLRLEADGVMKSWAVPKGPSMNPNDKHLAVMVEDHPIEYNTFEGTIPEGAYGAGEVRIWDSGTYEELGEPLTDQIAAGKITIILHGKKLKGEFHMVEMTNRGKNNWLLFKHHDEYSDESWQMKTILHYGSRLQTPSGQKKRTAGALERLVEKSKKSTSTKKRSVKSS